MPLFALTGRATSAHSLHAVAHWPCLRYGAGWRSNAQAAVAASVPPPFSAAPRRPDTASPDEMAVRQLVRRSFDLARDAPQAAALEVKRRLVSLMSLRPRWCQDLPLQTQLLHLAPKPADLLTLHDRQAVVSSVVVAIGLADPDRGSPGRSVQTHRPVLPTCDRHGPTRPSAAETPVGTGDGLRHRRLLSPNGSGVHQTGATPP